MDRIAAIPTFWPAPKARIAGKPSELHRIAYELPPELPNVSLLTAGSEIVTYKLRKLKSILSDTDRIEILLSIFGLLFAVKDPPITSTPTDRGGFFLKVAPGGILRSRHILEASRRGMAL